MEAHLLRRVGEGPADPRLARPDFRRVSARGQVVNLIDLTATMLDALGAEALPGVQGRSFLAVARSARAPWLDETFSEYCTDESPSWTGGMAVQTRMLRSGRWKLIYYHGYDPQLFDLRRTLPAG